MYKARSSLVAQNANLQYIDILILELRYYVTFYQYVGRLATYFGAYQLTTLCQTPVNDTHPGDVGVDDLIKHGFDTGYAVYLYWIFAAVGIVMSIHVILVAMYLSVFSEKLAIQGPPGSVIRSVTFLKSYERHILGTFTINIGVTAITTIFQFYCFMHLHLAYICGAIMFFGMVHWYRYSMNVYNHTQFLDPMLQELYDEYLNEGDDFGDTTGRIRRERNTRNSHGIPFASAFARAFSNGSQYLTRVMTHNIDEGDLEHGKPQKQPLLSEYDEYHYKQYQKRKKNGQKDSDSENSDEDGSETSTSGKARLSFTYQIGSRISRVFKKKPKKTTRETV